MLPTIGYMIAPVLYSNIYIIIKRKDRLGDGTCCPVCVIFIFILHDLHIYNERLNGLISI